MAGGRGDEDTLVVAEIEKSKAEVVRVQLRAYQGKRYVDLRTYYWDESGPEEELKPTRKGVTLRVEQLAELQAAVEALMAAAAETPTGARRRVAAAETPTRARRRVAGTKAGASTSAD